MPDLWIPGIPRVEPTNKARIPLGLQGRGRRLFTWHTFEAGYGLTATNGARYTNSQNSTPTFCFNPVSGELVQQLPANVGARTLQANGPSQHTNAYGDVHMQVEVIGYAARPFTLDLTAAGAASLTRLMNFLRSWGIPDQWAWKATVRPAATYAEANARGYRGQPDRSGHAFHSGWWANDHWDPGAIVAPWLVVPAPTKPKPAPKPAEPKPDPLKGFAGEHLERVESLLDVLGYAGADVWARVRAYQADHGLTADGLPGPQTSDHLEKTMSEILKRLDRIEAKIDNTPERVWTHPLYGFATHWWLRRGALGKRTDHANYPADPGSPADVERRVAEKILGEDVTPYTGQEK